MNMDTVLQTPIHEALTWLMYEYDLRRQKEHYEQIQRMKLKTN